MFGGRLPSHINLLSNCRPHFSVPMVQLTEQDPISPLSTPHLTFTPINNDIWIKSIIIIQLQAIANRINYKPIDNDLLYLLTTVGCRFVALHFDAWKGRITQCVAQYSIFRHKIRCDLNAIHKCLNAKQGRQARIIIGTCIHFTYKYTHVCISVMCSIRFIL